MSKHENHEETVVALIRRSMRQAGYGSRQVSNALKLWKSLYPKITDNFHKPELWAAAVELAVARLELEDEEINTRIARKYGVKLREVKAKCDEIWQRLKIQPFDPRFCSLPQILADMIVEEETHSTPAPSKPKKAKKPKPAHPEPPGDLPPMPLEEFVRALIEDPESVYRSHDHVADVALDWHEEHGFASAQKLLGRLINHFGSMPDDGINVDITADALVAMGECLQQEKRHFEAIPLLRRAADIHGNYGGALDDLGESHFALGQYVEAISVWREQMEVEGESSHPLLRIADAYEKLGHAAGMVSTLEEAARRFPKDIQSRERLCNHWKSAGDTARAQQCEREILAVRQPEGIEDITIWVKYNLDAGRLEPTLRWLHRYENDLGEQIEIRLYLLRAILLLALQRDEEALHEIRRARAIPNLCEHCWNRDLEALGQRFGEDVVARIRHLAVMI